MSRAGEIVHRHRQKMIEKHKEILEGYRRRGPLFAEAVDDVVARLSPTDEEDS